MRAKHTYNHVLNNFVVIPFGGKMLCTRYFDCMNVGSMYQFPSITNLSCNCLVSFLYVNLAFNVYINVYIDERRLIYALILSSNAYNLFIQQLFMFRYFCC